MAKQQQKSTSAHKSVRNRLPFLLFLSSIMLVVAAFWGAPYRTFRLNQGASSLLSFFHHPDAPGRSSQFIYSVFTPMQSTLWLGETANPAQKTPLAAIVHRDGYGPKASLSPSGESIAYLVLPPEGKDPAAEAELWLINVKTPKPRKLAGGFDLYSAPVWSQDSQSVALRTASLASQPPTYGLVLLDIKTAKRHVLVQGLPVLGIYPIGWTAGNNALVYATISASGTEFHELTSSTGEHRLLLSISGGLARDFRIHPQRQQLLFTVYDPQHDPLYRVEVFDMREGVQSSVLQDQKAFLSPVWKPDSGLVTAGSDPENGRLHGGIASVSLGVQSEPSPLVSAPGAFFAPIAWSPSGGILAARRFFGTDLGHIVNDQVMLLTDAGKTLRTLDGQGYVEFVGWIP